MPVLVTGATGCVGRALIPRLVDSGGQVRVYVRRDVPEYRALGVKVAVGEADHEGHLEAALEQVHTLVHLTGGVDLDPGVTLEWLNLTSTEVAVRAAENAEVRRILFLSPLHADPASPHEYLAVKGRAEELIRGAKLEHAIFRCAPIWGPGSVLERALARNATNEVRMDPIAVADVAAALLAADTRDAELRGTWELGGPETMTVSELASRAGVKRRAFPGLGGPKIAFQRDQVADPSEALRQFGLKLTAVP